MCPPYGRPVKAGIKINGELVMFKRMSKLIKDNKKLFSNFLITYIAGFCVGVLSLGLIAIGSSIPMYITACAVILMGVPIAAFMVWIDSVRQSLKGTPEEGRI